VFEKKKKKKKAVAFKILDPAQKSKSLSFFTTSFGFV
jgi:hypothetical protein